MSDTNRTVPMFLVNPGSTAPDGEFTFELQPRVNAGRTVKFALGARDAEQLRNKLDEYLKSLK